MPTGDHEKGSKNIADDADTNKEASRREDEVGRNMFRKKHDEITDQENLAENAKESKENPDEPRL